MRAESISTEEERHPSGQWVHQPMDVFLNRTGSLTHPKADAVHLLRQLVPIDLKRRHLLLQLVDLGLVLGARLLLLGPHPRCATGALLILVLDVLDVLDDQSWGALAALGLVTIPRMGLLLAPLTVVLDVLQGRLDALLGWAVLCFDGRGHGAQFFFELKAGDGVLGDDPLAAADGCSWCH